MIARLRGEGLGTDDVSRGGYYAHRRKLEGRHRQEDAVLRSIVASAFAQSLETYGTPRLREVVSGLTEAHVSRTRIARLKDEPRIAPP